MDSVTIAPQQMIAAVFVFPVVVMLGALALLALIAAVSARKS